MTPVLAGGRRSGVWIGGCLMGAVAPVLVLTFVGGPLAECWSCGLGGVLAVRGMVHPSHSLEVAKSTVAKASSRSAHSIRCGEPYGWTVTGATIPAS